MTPISLRNLLTCPSDESSDESDLDIEATIDEAQKRAEEYLQARIQPLTENLTAIAGAIDEVIQEQLTVTPYDHLEETFSVLEAAKRELVEQKAVQREELRKSCSALVAGTVTKKELIDSFQSTKEKIRKAPPTSRAIATVQTASSHISSYIAHGIERAATTAPMSYYNRPPDQGFRSKEKVDERLAKLRGDIINHQLKPHNDPTPKSNNFPY
ncbi:MAG: hypothetical protein KGI80_02520 [Verrucomicrobiota bacterium]|nr:hypothetical protein [Verrucomicrobiota bacterium]